MAESENKGITPHHGESEKLGQGQQVGMTRDGGLGETWRKPRRVPRACCGSTVAYLNHGWPQSSLQGSCRVCHGFSQDQLLGRDGLFPPTTFLPATSPDSDHDCMPPASCVIYLFFRSSAIYQYTVVHTWNLALGFLVM